MLTAGHQEERRGATSGSENRHGRPLMPQETPIGKPNLGASQFLDRSRWTEFRTQSRKDV
jgi:hypothetical protein